MIGQMSPPVRRIVAVGLLLLSMLIILQYFVAPFMTSIADRRDVLFALRTRASVLEQAQRRVLPAQKDVPPGMGIVAVDASAATKRLLGLVAADAAAAKVTLNQALPCQASRDSHMLCIVISASGHEIQIAHLLSLIERGSPVMRLRQWQLGAGAGGTQLNLIAEIHAVRAEPE